MNCDDAIERLPWLLNGTLEEEVRRQVLEHLEGCERCRAALGESRDAWRIYAAHIPTEDLVAHAWGEPTGTDSELLADHLAACAQCSAELEMVRTSRQLEEDDRVALFAPRRPAAPPAETAPAVPAAARATGSAGKWRAAALAASLAGLVAIGGWFETVGRLRSTEDRLAAAQVREAPVPQASKFFTPQSFAMRDGGSQEAVTLPITIDLSTLQDLGTYDVEIVEAQGKVLWKGEALDPGQYGLVLPEGSLAPGNYTILAHRLENGSRTGEPVRFPLTVAAPSAP